MTPEERIRSKAAELGFSKVGFAKAESLAVEGEHLQEWLDQGYDASMSWMERNAEKRKDLRLIVPDAMSVISVAMNYATPHEHVDLPGVGKISRYAWGDDYHDLLTKKLRELHAWLESQFEEYAGRYYVDTGPILEKVWAQRAGLGWLGKHTNLITQDMGSWVFLGEIITSLKLAPDTPATDHCGTCTLCIDACPTDAIVQEYVVDAGRCISYLTIEHRGEIAESLGQNFRSWIYGCDICQDVCPWNAKFAQPSAEPAFAPRPGFKEPHLAEWAEMTQEEFSSRFKGSPIKRTKREGLVRNIAVVSRSS